MKILALDSTATAASVAVCDDTRLLAEYTVQNGNTHSETLLPMIEFALGTLSLEVSDIDIFACSCGPGSFTGVRIGAATVKGLAFSTGKPCIGVSTLEALAYNLIGYEGLICPVMNARRSQVYTALFSCDRKKITRLLPDSAILISELDELLEKEGREVMLCGDGYDITLSESQYGKILQVPERQRIQSAYSVACVALEKYNSGEFVSDNELVATYLRPCQAERELAEKIKKDNFIERK